MYVPNVGNNTMQLGCDQSTMIQRKCAQVMNVEDTMYKINTHLGVDQIMDTHRWMPYDINALH